MLQICWERGWVDSSLVGQALEDAYTVGGKKDKYGQKVPGSSLSAIVSALPDFVNEVTLLQYYAEKRSIQAGCQIMLIRSPKCHPELAGEGIEYDWAAAKKFYRTQTLSRKKGKPNFRALVIESLSKVTLAHRYSFSRRAREYMGAYETVEQCKNELNDKNIKLETSAHLLDKVVSE